MLKVPFAQNAFKRMSAYVTQDDRLLGTQVGCSIVQSTSFPPQCHVQTVRETLRFYADLKLTRTKNSSAADRARRVEEVIDELGLQKVADSRIGTQFRRGISGGEKKRVSIGTELITDPSLLFLDEPTTG